MDTLYCEDSNRISSVHPASSRTEAAQAKELEDCSCIRAILRPGWTLEMLARGMRWAQTALAPGVTLPQSVFAFGTPTRLNAAREAGVAPARRMRGR